MRFLLQVNVYYVLFMRFDWPLESAGLVERERERERTFPG